MLHSENEAAEKELNKLGEDGWELVGASGNTRANRGASEIKTTERLVFKRPKR